MGHVRVEFYAYRENLSAITTTVNLDRSPFGVQLPGGSTITAELTFTSTGGSEVYIAADRWLMAWRMSATNTVSTSILHLVADRLGYAGHTAGILESATAVGGSGFGFTFTPAQAGRDWTIRGVYWADDKEYP